MDKCAWDNSLDTFLDAIWLPPVVIVCSKYDAENLAKKFDASNKAEKTAIIVWAKVEDEQALVQVWRFLIADILHAVTSEPTTTSKISQLVAEYVSTSV